MARDRQVRVSLAEPRAARAGSPEAAAACEQARLRFELAKAVRARQEELGWSQRQSAERAGMTQPGVARFEAGAPPDAAAAGAPGRRARPDRDRQPGPRRPQDSLMRSAGRPGERQSGRAGE
jgi:hypothetical protein